MPTAVIYLRVSDPRQVERLSLDTQEAECRAYCQREGLAIDRVFREEGRSGESIAGRRELIDMLAHVRQSHGTIATVVVYDTSRFARDAFEHQLIRRQLAQVGAVLRSPSQRLGETPEDQFIELVLAGSNQLENQIRRRKSMTGLREALRRGRWCSPPPLGYQAGRSAAGEKTLVFDPVRAPLVRRGFELVASGQHSRAEVLELVTAMGLLGRHGRPLSRSRWEELLGAEVYRGRLVAQVDGERIEAAGNWPALVDDATWLAVQSQRVRPSVAPYVQRSADFPLRRFVRCSRCGGPFTGAWATSHTGARHAYYRCYSRLCPARPNVRAAVLEAAWVALLETLRPHAATLRAIRAVMLDAYADRRRQAAEQVAARDRQLAVLRTRRDRLVEAYVCERALDRPTYDRLIASLDEQIVAAEVDRHGATVDQVDIEGTIAFAERILENAATLWKQSTLDQRQRMQASLFPEGVQWDGKGVVGTLASAWDINNLGADCEGENGVVVLAGVGWNPASFLIEAGALSCGL
jgi:site-specific DNA recombinase